MKTTSTNPETFESTYALLVRSEEKQRSRFETLEHRACVDDRICPRATQCLISDFSLITPHSQQLLIDNPRALRARN